MQKILFIEYPKCSTCQKAKKWLEINQINFSDRHIIENPPSSSELRKWYRLSGKSLKNFFNTNGLKYKALQLKDKLSLISENEQFELLSSDGMLVKRPLLIGTDFILIGFKEDEWQKNLNKIKH